MNAPTQAMPDAPDLRLDHKTLAKRATDFGMSAEDLEVLQQVVTAIGRAATPQDPAYSPMIERHVTMVNLAVDDNRIRIIMLSDLKRVFDDPALFKELCKLFPETANDTTAVVCWKFLNEIYNRY